MTKVIPFKRQPIVVHKPSRAKTVDRSGTWAQSETRNLQHRLDQGLPLLEVIRLTMEETRRNEKSVRAKIDLLQPKPAFEKYTSGPPARKDTGLSPDSPVAKTLATLAGRVRTTEHGYFLDGRPSSFYLCVREANRVRKARGEKQIIGSHEWLL